MSEDRNRMQDEERAMRDALKGAFDAPMPPEARRALEETYARLEGIPQMPAAQAGDRVATGENAAAPAFHPMPGGRAHRAPHIGRRAAIAVAAAAVAALVGGGAFAASQLAAPGQGGIAFFRSGGGLGVYDSLQTSSESLTVDVGASSTVDGFTATLDSVSCDRNIVNLFLTLTNDGGFDLASLSSYEGSQEGEWDRLQRVLPHFRATLRDENGEQTLAVRQLDAYQTDAGIVCMMRIVPERVLGDSVDIELDGALSSFVTGDGEQDYPHLSLSAGLDLSGVVQPSELGAQHLTFNTSEGEKSIRIARFTRSTLGCVMVVDNEEEITIAENGHPDSSGRPEGVLAYQQLKITDNEGNVLTEVNAGDGLGYAPGADWIVELAGISPTATSVSFTPMLTTYNASDGSGMPDSNTLFRTVDVSQIGTDIAESEYGGYTIVGRTVEDHTETLELAPHGWVDAGAFGIATVDPATPLYEEYTGYDGKTYGGNHYCMQYIKFDYETGHLLVLTSYYAASNEEIEGLTQCKYLSSFGMYREESDATVTVPLA